MKSITELTQAQKDRLPKLRDEWIKRCLEPRLGDRAKAERALRLAYEAAKLEPPRLIIWMKDPLAGIQAAGGTANDGDPIREAATAGLSAIQVLSQVRDQVDAEVSDQVRDQVFAQVRAQVDAKVYDQVFAQVSAQVYDQVRSQVSDQVYDQVRSQVSDQVDDQIRSQVSAQVGDQVSDQVRAQVSAQVYAQVRAEVGDQVYDQVSAQVSAQVYAQVRAEVGDQVYAQVRAQVLSQVDAQVLSQVDDQIRSQVRDQVGDQVDDQIRAQVGAQVRDQVRAQVHAQVDAQVDAQVYDQVDAQVGDQVGDHVRAQIDAQVYDQVYDQVLDQVSAQVRAQVSDQVYDQVSAHVRAQVLAQVSAQVGDQVSDQVRAQVGDQVDDRWRSAKQLGWRRLWGQYDGWLSYYDAHAELGVAGCEQLRPLMDLSNEAGWCWVWGGIAVMTDRHTVLHRDEENRLHCEDGPAISWSSGWGIYVWHGTRIPEEWIKDPDSLTAQEALAWDNVEQRRAAIEILGWTRVLEEIGARVIDEDEDKEIGTLLEADLPGATHSQFLRVRCGTGRDFVLPVPPSSEGITTALQAQSWMWELPESEIKQLETRT